MTIERDLGGWWLLVFGAAVVWVFFAALRARTRALARRNEEMEQRLREQADALAKASATKAHLLEAVSHEIRNPMNGVLGIVKMLQDAKLGVREKYLLNTLHRCAEQMRVTVDGVLDVSKLAAGEVALKSETFDLAETIRSTIAAADPVDGRARLTSWVGASPMVEGDQAKLTHVLSIYLTNALTYGVPPRADVEVVVVDKGGARCEVRIAVAAFGSDIPGAELATLFERFERGEFSPVRRIGGSGLGLAICKTYAQAMGGTVGVTSARGSTVFYVTLPFSMARTTAHKTRDVQPGSVTRVLAIEDENYNRLVLGNVLTGLGYTVDWAADGKSALELVRQHRYDLILADCMLPDIDGIALTKELHALCAEPKPPVFAVTAYSTKEKYDACLAAGMAGFITKPITAEQVEASLRGWRAQRGQTVADSDEADPARLSPVSLLQLSKLGTPERIVPEFVQRLESDWAQIETLVTTAPLQAAAAVHRMISATLLVDARYVSDQLRLFEEQLRLPASETTQHLLEICREEVAKVAASLRAAVKRQQQLNAGQTPT